MGEPHSDSPGRHVGLQHACRERRRQSRRGKGRFAWDRRRVNRRKQQLRTILFAAAALVTPGQVARLYPFSHSGVSISITSFMAVPPERAYDRLIREASEAHGVDAALIRAVMRTESSFDPFVVSPAGAQGLMQLMPTLAEEMGVTDVFDPRQNIMGGAKYLRQLLDATGGNVPLALASYNAGPGTVARYKGIPPFKETREYVKKITALLADEEERRAITD